MVFNLGHAKTTSRGTGLDVWSGVIPPPGAAVLGSIDHFPKSYGPPEYHRRSIKRLKKKKKHPATHTHIGKRTSERFEKVARWQSLLELPYQLLALRRNR